MLVYAMFQVIVSVAGAVVKLEGENGRLGEGETIKLLGLSKFLGDGSLRQAFL